MLVSTLAKERVCSREMIDLLPIADFVPTLKSLMVGIWRRGDIFRCISEICIVFLWCRGFSVYRGFPDVVYEKTVRVEVYRYGKEAFTRNIILR